MPNMFAINPGRVGALDVLIPLAMELREQYPNLRLTLIYFDQPLYQQLMVNPVLLDALRSMGRAYLIPGNVLGKVFPPLIVKLVHWLLAVPLILSLSLSRRSLFMVYGEMAGWQNRIIYLLNKINGGKTYTHMGAISSYNECLRRHFDEDLRPRNPKSKTCKNIRRKNTADGLLIYHPVNINYLKLLGFSNFKIVGYPILFNKFKEYIALCTGDYVARELGLDSPPEKHECTTVFINKYWGKWASKDDNWAMEAFRAVVHCIRKHKPDAWILTRPHPMLTGERLEQFRIYAGGDKIVFTNLHPSVLALSSAYVIAIAQSTSFLHVMGFGTPYVEYGEMTEEQYNIFPEGSLFAEFGTVVATNRDELCNLLPEVEKNKTGVDYCLSKIDHKTDLSFIIDCWGSSLN